MQKNSWKTSAICMLLVVQMLVTTAIGADCYWKASSGTGGTGCNNACLLDSGCYIKNYFSDAAMTVPAMVGCWYTGSKLCCKNAGGTVSPVYWSQTTYTCDLWTLGGHCDWTTITATSSGTSTGPMSLKTTTPYPCSGS